MFPLKKLKNQIKEELVDKLGFCNFVCCLLTVFFSLSGVEGSDKGEPEEEVAKPNHKTQSSATCGRDKAQLRPVEKKSSLTTTMVL